MKDPAGLEVTVGDKGEVIIKVPDNAKSGDHDVVITITDKDGKSHDETIKVHVPEDTAPTSPTVGDQFPSDVSIPRGGDKTLTPVDLPDGSKVTVKDPAGLEVTVDDKGKVTIHVPDNAKVGDHDVVITITDKDGKSHDETIKVHVPDPTKPADWDNTGTVPGGTVEIPNKGGEVKPGTTVEVDQPGWTATIDDNGNIHVTTPTGATPGTKGTVTVKDKDGKVIDKVEVTVVPKENVILIPRDAVTNVGPVADDPASCTIEPHVIIPATTGVIYSINGKDVTAGEYTYNYGETVKVTARAAEGYVLAAGSVTEWTWTAPTKEECLKGKGTHGSIGGGLIPLIIAGGIIGSIIGGHGSTDGSTGSNGGHNGGNQGNQQGNNGGSQNGQQGNNSGNQNGQQTGPQKGMPADGQNNGGQNNGAASQPQKGKGMLASTGVQAFGAAMLAGLVAMILGIAFLMVRRRKDS